MYRATLRAACCLLAATGLTGLLAGCGSASDPLVLHTQQAGFTFCAPEPNPDDKSFSRWDTPLGAATGMYYNQSSSPLTVQSVSLVAAHNMVLHAAMVHEMPQYKNPLPIEFTWEYGTDGGTVDARLVQPVPGAVIPAGIGPVSNFPQQHPDVYDIGVDITARQRGAAWAAGVNVGYTAGGQAHSIRLLIGLSIAAGTGRFDQQCGAASNAIRATWASLQGG